ncbi:MAG: VWA domain-containing protein [Candidatus Pristimantibacillus sp.]
MLITSLFRGKRSILTVVFTLLAVLLVIGGCSGSNNSSDQAINASESASENSEKSADSGSRERDTEHSSAAVQGDDRAPTGEEPAPEREKESDGGRRYGSKDAVQQAGQLTAGEWDDLAAWERFGNLLNSREGDSNLRHWNFSNFDRLEVSVTANGRAVADARVLLSNEQEVIWEARTDTDGRAYLFTNLFEDRGSERQSNYKVEVRADQQETTFDSIKIPEQDVLKLTLDKEIKPSDRVDVMFVVDTTGSMEDELNYLGAELKDVITRVGKQHANQLDIRVSTNFYRDKHDDYVVKPYPFTRDIDKAVGQIVKQKASGGGDYPEAVDQALRDAIREHDWSEEARTRLLFLVLDAPPHDEAQTIDEIHDLIAEAAQQGIRIIPVTSSGTDVETEYLTRFMAVATGGTYLFLTDDSGIGGDHLEPAAGEYEVKLLNDLLVEVINRYVQP